MSLFISGEQESLGWGPVLASLQVPELTVEDFLSESQSGGSFLTLYAFILQRLNTEYTAANERRILALINTWTNQVFPRLEPPCLFTWPHYFGVIIHTHHTQSTTLNPVSLQVSMVCGCIVTICGFFWVSSGPGDEAKLFLWWHKALNLSAEQLQPQSSQTEVSGVVMGLQKLETRLLQLGEERLNFGLLGAIGLGKRSPVSNR